MQFLSRIKSFFFTVVVIVGSVYIIYHYYYLPLPKKSSVLNGTIPALYPGLSWEPRTIQAVGFLGDDGKSLYLTAYRRRAAVVYTYPNDFTEYYHQELRSRGWRQRFHAGKNSPSQLVQYVYQENGKKRYFVFAVYFKGYPTHSEYQAVVEHN